MSAAAKTYWPALTATGFLAKPLPSPLPPHDIYVSESLIPGAGLGLFAARDFKSGERICAYGGVLRERRGLTSLQRHYSVYITKELVRDASSETEAVQPGRYVNHAPAAAASATFSVYMREKTVSIKAKRAIRRGEEIYICYGSDYWRDHKNGDPELYAAC